MNEPEHSSDVSVSRETGLENVEFRDRMLGWASSHPNHIERRFFWIKRLSWIPLVILGVLIVARILNLEQIPVLLGEIPEVMVGIVCLAGFALTVQMSIAILLRISVLQQHGLRSRILDTDNWIPNADFKLVIIGGICGLVLPSVLFLVNDPLRILGTATSGSWSPFRIMGGLLAVLPLMCVLLALQITEIRLLGKKVRYRENSVSIMLGFMGMVVVALLIVTVAYDLVQLLKNKVSDLQWKERLDGLSSFFDEYLPWYPSLGKLFYGLVYLFPSILLIYTLKRVVLTPRIVEEDSEEKEESAESDRPREKATWKKVLGWFWPFGKKRKGSAADESEGSLPEPEEPDPLALAGVPEWVRDVLNSAEIECEDAFENRVEDGSPLETNLPPEGWLFGTKIIPTRDQCVALKGFSEMTRRVRQGRNGGAEILEPADVLVHGETGAGKTATLQAMAILALISRGQRCVVLVPSQGRANAWTGRFRALARELGYAEFLEVFNFEEHREERQTLIGQWLETEDTFPDIFIGTVEDFHAWFYEQSNREKSIVRQLVTLLEVVFVEDFFEHPSLVQQHLPFILDKHRLLLESFCCRLQTVVSMPELGEFAVRNVVPRLFPRIENPGRHAFPIRVRRDLKGWRLVLRSEDPRNSLIALAVVCLNAGQKVLIFQKDADRRRLSQLESEVTHLVENHDSSLLEVHGDIDDLPAHSVDAANAILTITHMDDNLGFALQARGKQGENVIFQIMPKNGLRSCHEPSGAVSPILPARNARGFLIEHLCGALAAIPRRWPIPYDAWCRLVSPPDTEGSQPHERVERVLAEFTVDQALENGRSKVSYIYLDQLDARPNERLGPVSIYRYPARAGRIATDQSRENGLNLDLFFDNDRKDLGTCEVKWTSHAENRLELDRSDLRHLVDFRLHRGSGFLVPHTFRFLENENCYEIETTFAEGAGYDAIYPKWQIDWTGLPGANHIQCKGGGSHPIRFFSVDLLDHGLITCCLEQRFNEFGDIEDISPRLEYSYRARATGIILGANDVPGEFNLWAQKLLDRPWSTRYDAAVRQARLLTLAFEHSFRQLLPGYENYGKCVAEKISESDLKAVGSAVIWVFEPDTSGTSISSVIMSHFNSKTWREGFLKHVLEVLKQLGTKEGDVRDRAARVNAGLDISAAESGPADLDFAIGAVKIALGEMSLPDQIDLVDETDEGIELPVAPPPGEIVPIDSPFSFDYAWGCPDKSGGEGDFSRLAVDVPSSDIEAMKRALLPSKGRHYTRNQYRGVEDLFTFDGPLMRKVGEEPMKRFIAQIASRAHEQRLSRKDLADQILHFVQREIKYEHDIDTTGFEEYGRFPLQTLYDGHGDCECAAILALAILLYLGYDCAMLVFEFNVGGIGHVDPGLLVDPLEIDEWGIERREDLFFEPASRRHYLYGCTANDAFEGSPWGPKIERFNSLKIATTTIIPLSAKRWRVFDWEDEPEKTNTDDSSEE